MFLIDLNGCNDRMSYLDSMIQITHLVIFFKICLSLISTILIHGNDIFSPKNNGLFIYKNENIEILFSAHDKFLEYPLSGTLNVKRPIN